MELNELRTVLAAGEAIEYHCMGREQNARLLPGPGWYPCRIAWMYPNGDVEITLIGEHDGLGVTVLEKNIAIAFRRISRLSV